MLPSNTASSAADSDGHAVNGASCAVVNGVELDSVEVNGSETSCCAPVTDPDSLALLAAMCEANRLTALCFPSLRRCAAN